MISLDDNCYNYWKESYENFIAESNNLMLFMTLHWDEYKLQEKVNLIHYFRVDFFVSLKQKNCLKC